MSVEHVNSNGFIQRILAKCQPFAKTCAENFAMRKALSDVKELIVLGVGVGMEREYQTLTLLCYGEYSNKGAYKYHGDPGKDRLSLPRKKSEKAS